MRYPHESDYPEEGELSEETPPSNIHTTKKVQKALKASRNAGRSTKGGVPSFATSDMTSDHRGECYGAIINRATEKTTHEKQEVSPSRTKTGIG